MIQRIRNSRAFRLMCVFLAMNIVAEIIAPTQALALTGGPAQPEFGSFTPIGASDMVDLSSGDLNYNIPLMDVGGYPINIAYSSGVGMDDEASWVGLGWNLSVGQINRNVRGIPDDFKGDKLTYENNMKPNVTVGANVKFQPSAVGVDKPLISSGQVAATYNNYSGFSIKPSISLSKEIHENVSIGFNIQTGSDGLAVSPSLSIHKRGKDSEGRNTKLSCNVGVSMNSRQGLTATTFSAQKELWSKETDKQKADPNSEHKSYQGGPSVGSSIGFAESSYSPSKRVGMVTGTFTVNTSVGGEFFGVEGQLDVTAYGTVQKVSEDEKYKQLKAYGYQHSDLATIYDVLDFNREKESSVTKNATNLAVTNYTYDIYSVQGQGVGGMYRPYRNQVGYVYDARVQDGSFSGSLGLEFGVGNAAHFGIDIEATQISSYSGLWQNNNSMLQYLQENQAYNPRYEKVHFKNAGDLSSDEEMDDSYVSMFNKTGRYQALRVSYVGNKFDRRAVSEYKQKIDGEGHESIINASSPVKRSKRKTRNQAIFNLTKKDIKSGYGPVAQGEWSGTSPTDPYATKGTVPDHHTSEVQIVRNDGARYIYGLPVYNTLKREATFAVEQSSGNATTGSVTYAAGVDNSASSHVNDRYFNRVTTPAYAHSYLLTSVLSTDYQDKGTAGPSTDDLGSYTKISYVVKAPNYKWRVPYGANRPSASSPATAAYNEGLRCDSQDDRGNYVYGEKELIYVSKIETKTHVAEFILGERHDAYGVKDENGGLGSTEKSYYLKKIILWAKQEYQVAGATPIKEVNFVYDYSLCPNVPNNDQAVETVDGVNINAAKGKLTLKQIYFTYRGSKMGKYNSYKFNYNAATNYAYNIKGYDYWGNYQPALKDGTTIPAAEFPYTEQDVALQNNYAAAWTMNSIDLPSGGKITINYESDDYAYVQDKAAMRMYQVLSAGNEAAPAESYLTNPQHCSLYEKTLQKKPYDYLYIKLGTVSAVGSGQADVTKRITAAQLLNGLGDYVHFRFLTNMTQAGGAATLISTAGDCDYVTGYMKLAGDKIRVFETGANVYASIWVEHVDRNASENVDNAVHPITMASWNFGKKYLNSCVYNNQPNDDNEDILEIVQELFSPQILSNLQGILAGPNAVLETKLIGRNFVKDRSWIRLTEPTGRKLGGGCRVSEIRTSDAWEQMNGESPDTPDGYQTMNYGQSYSYTLENGKTSGVATYEPIGNKENPFVQPVFSKVNRILAPDEDNYAEQPFGESFFPSPTVTYARVTVKSLAGGKGYDNQTVKALHRTGSVVTEFYTSRDYPTFVDQTILDLKEDKRELLQNLLKVNMKTHFTASQGYIVHLNDMNGKQKSQRVYAEGQQGAISGVDYLYDNYSTPQDYNATTYPERNKGTLNNNVKVIYPNGAISMKTIGVEEDVVNDFMYNQTRSQTTGMNMNLATFFIGIIPGVVPMPLPDMSFSEDKFQAVSTTKVINTFGILKETIAYEDGAKVSTRNLAWDAITGEVLVTETVDEFSDQYYTFSYPAHWYYQGMGQASRNLGIDGTLQGSTGIYTMAGISSSSSASDFLIPGDEIAYGLPDANGIRPKAWVSEVSGNSFRLIKQDGTPVTYTADGQPIPANSFMVIRSGHRNLQSAGIMNVTLMKNPLTTTTGAEATNLGTSFLNMASWDGWKIIQAGAVDYTDNWPAGCECGVDGTTINPYVVNAKGVWRTRSSRTYLTGRLSNASLNPRLDGFMTGFAPMYRLTSGGNWAKDMTGWTFVSQVTRFSPYGLELENVDALNRYSSAQYGYNNTLPMAVGANARYRQIGFDGFEDYALDACTTNRHFSFKGLGTAVNTIAHTGRSSMLVPAKARVTMTKTMICPKSLNAQR